MAHYYFVCPNARPTVPPIEDQIEHTRYDYDFPTPCTWTDETGDPWEQGTWEYDGRSRELARQYRCTIHRKRPFVYQRHNPLQQRRLAILEQHYIQIPAYNPAAGAQWLIDDAIARGRRHIIYPTHLQHLRRSSASVWIPRRPPSPTLHTGW